MVGIHRHNNCFGSGSGRVVDRARLLALGFLYQCSARRRGSRYLVVAGSGVSQRDAAKNRLAGSAGRNHRSGGTGVWVSRIRFAGLEQRPGSWKLDRWIYRAHSFPVRRKTSRRTHGSAVALQIARVQRRQSIDTLSLCRTRCFLISVSVELDPDTRVLSYRHGRGCSTHNFAHVCSFTMVGRSGYSLWSNNRWSADRRSRLPSVCLAVCWR